MENYAFTWNGETQEKLRAGLEGLTGYDFERAEREEMKSGNNAAFVATNKAFQARLASYALNVPVPEIKRLPLREYNELTTEVFTFLYVGSEEKEAQANSTDK